jgi:hypothetical protein
MWDYTDRRDSTRFSFDELREAEIDVEYAPSLL